MCLKCADSLPRTANDFFLSFRIPKKLAYCLVEKFGPEDGMRLLIGYIHRKDAIWRDYDSACVIWQHSSATKRKQTFARQIKEEWNHAFFDALRRGRKLPFGRSSFFFWRKASEHNWLIKATDEWIAAKSNTRPDFRGEKERSKRVLLEEIQRLDDEYIAMLEQKASENELVQLKESGMKEKNERACTCVCKCQDNKSDDVEFFYCKE